ncbi:MAG: histidine kinase, partial [Saprospiraceae bacterium]
PLHIVKYLFLIAGVFLMAAIYFFFLFYQQPKEYSVFIFGIICLLFFALILMEYLKYYYAYPYEFQRTRLDIIGYLHNSIALLIPLYFMIQFSISWKKVISGIIVLGIIGIEYYYDYSYDYSAWANDRMMWGVSILLVAYAVYKKEKGALIILIGLIISALLPSFPFFYDVPFVSAFDISLFIGFVMILLLMFYLLTLKRSEERKAYEASLVKSERLKNELLKKNIRPHFIMNTLTSLIDWVEESPKEGVQFIHALAGEFEVLNQIADYKLIPINQEIKLCKNHLRVMRFRKEINYRWEEEGIDPNEIIPPAIIHTAVENGITHSLPDESGNILFRLIYNNTPTSKEYCLQTHAKNRPLESEQFTNLKDGTGSKYIKSRLQESYGDKWQLESERRDYGWEMRILLFK